MIFLVEDGIPTDTSKIIHRYSKGEKGIATLATQLPYLVRAAKIASIELDIWEDIQPDASTNIRTRIAEKAIVSLGELGFTSMFISIDPRMGRWVIRASTYPDDAIGLIESMVAKGGQVIPQVDEAPLEFQRMLSGGGGPVEITLKELLSLLMSWLSERDLKRLQRALSLETAFLFPVVHREEMHGVLAVGGPLSDEEQLAISQFTPNLARSLSNSKKRDERSARAQGLQTLQKILVSVSSTLNESQLMEKVLDLLTQVVAYDGARVYVREEDQIELKASRGNMRSAAITQWQVDELGESGSVFWRTHRIGEPNLISEVVDHTVLGEPDSKDDWLSWMAVPIRWRDQINGLLTLVNKTQGFFQPLQLEITESVAQQLGVAHENARLLEHSIQRAEKLKIVHEIGRSSVSLLDSQLLVFEAAQKVIQIFEYDQVGIFMVDENELVPEIFLYGKEMRERKGISNINLNTGTIFDEAVRANIHILLSDLDEPSGLESIPGTKRARAAMLIPLAIKGAVVGVMLVLSHKSNGINEGDIDILQVLAAQLGISLVNARLFSEVRAHAANLERRVAERTDELQSQKERTEAILRSVADAVMVLDLEGRLIMANPMAQSLLGRVWSEQIYQRVVDLQKDGTQEQATWEFGAESFEALASNVVLDGQVIGTVIVLRDITRLKELDRLKSQFVATVSHELRTPLANIKLYLSLLRRSQAEREPHYFQTLETETERLTTMIEDLLDLSRLDTELKVEFRPLALGDLLREIIKTQRPVCANKRIDLVFKATDQPLVMGNRDRLIQVFTNLLANAIAYTPAGDSIHVRMGISTSADDKLGAYVEVEDTGVGIPADELPYVFDRFYRGRMAQQLKIHGSGLGLAIVREIIESHGGNISVSSDIGKGTCFRLWLPLAEGGEDNYG
jgi:two-component system phosphate regulon sensor histidine kinase PhoR